LKQNYFIVVLAHSLHGRLQRIHISHRIVYGSALTLAVMFLALFGVAGSYARMLWKVSNYNTLQHEADLLRARYENLQKKVRQTNEQLASLQLLADEVSTAYGVRQRISGSAAAVEEAPLVPTVPQSLAEYDFLRTAALTHQRNIFARADAYVIPSIWPITGRLVDGFGHRNDPFSGEGAMHTGIDISAPQGTAVKATADGIVIHASWNAGYGRCVVLDHGNGYQTLYGHLSRIEVIDGQEIRRGEIVGRVGSTGHSTGPHLHYEVRIRATPVNPYRFLSRPVLMKAAAPSEFPF
jgi:murein DD-endopeptidase MepM/ murein hydrolase activator NlpD